MVPKSVTKSRITSNLDVFDFNLTDEEMILIDSFDCNGRVVVMAKYVFYFTVLNICKLLFLQLQDSSRLAIQ